MRRGLVHACASCAVENRARVLLGIVRRQAAICTGAFFDIFWLGVSTREACGF